MDITVIVPTYNRSALLRRTLQGFCELAAGKLLWELIIVSDDSTDSTHQTVIDFEGRLPVKYLCQPKRGVASARNLGLRETNSPVVLFVDDDVIPSPQLLEEHARFHRERAELESVLLGYVTWSPELVVTPFMRWYGEFGGLFGFSLLKENKVGDPRYFYSCNISFKTEFLRKNNGFNESLSVLEDHELGYRLHTCGMKMYFRRAAIGYHNQSFTFDQACQRLERYSEGLPAFYLTEAGKAMGDKRAKLRFRIADAIVRLMGPALSPFRPLLNSKIRFPNAVYRLFYWYYGSQQAFWSRSAWREPR
ncbi:glycosyltransferase [Granulicella sp. dw_53]|uniref:glycosyltransferase n=1 Tax=Granulicella sp. dw_53 TaxID=2719792 RepID=UPI001BD1D2EB|nr:glycosyltransferase [Granulicella sp. dw_53]